MKNDIFQQVGAVWELIVCDGIWTIRGACTMVILMTALFFLTSCGPSVKPPKIELMVLPSYNEPGESVKQRLTAGAGAAATTTRTQDYDAGEVSLSLQDVVALVLRNNRDIRVAYQGPPQAKADLLSARAAYDPEAFAEWQHQRNSNPNDIALRPTNKRYYNDTERVGLRQSLPTGASVSTFREWTSGVEWAMSSSKQKSGGGAYVLEITQPLLNGFGNREVKANIEISRVRYDYSEESLRQAMIKSTADALDTYWNVALAHEDVRIYEETLKMAQTLLAREIKRQSEGISTELDVDRAKEAVATRTMNLLSAKDQEHMYQERLKLLLNNPRLPVGSGVKIKTVEVLQTPIVRTNLEKSIKAALSNRPEIRKAKLGVKVGEIQEKYARHNIMPNLNLIGRMRANDHHSNASIPGYDTDSLGRDWSVGVVFSMPLGNMKARAGRDRAESELKQARMEANNAEDVIISEIKTSVKSIDILALEMPQSDRAVEAAKKVVDGEWARFELNQVGNRDLLQAQDLLAVSERNRIQSLIHYNTAIISLLAAEGTLLDHLGVIIR